MSVKGFLISSWPTRHPGETSEGILGLSEGGRGGGGGGGVTGLGVCV